MIGLLVGTVCTAATLYAFVSFESQKRTTIAGNEAQQEGAFALHLLERQIRSAGASIVQGKNYGVWGCTLLEWSGATQRLPLQAVLPPPFAKWPTTVRAIPVLIAAGDGDESDALGVFHGDSAVRVFRSNIDHTAGNTVWLDNALGFERGDTVLLSDKQGRCPLARVATTDLPTRAVALAAAGSPPGDISGYLAGDAWMFNLGPQPAYTLYGVTPDSLSLQAIDLLSEAPAAPVADHVASIKALYGVDDGSDGGVADDGAVDAWVRPTGPWGIDALDPAGSDDPASATARGRIMAVRLAVVVRSAQPEREGAPVAEGEAPAFISYTGADTLELFTDIPAATVSVKVSPRYRYRVFETTIPLRNALVTRFF
jgi:type IV pilus assembly protein PilW